MSIGTFNQMLAGAIAAFLPLSAAAQDWDGAYGGVTLGWAASENNYNFNDTYDEGPYKLEGSVAGLFAGYNVQPGALVYGVEISANFGDVRGLPSGYDNQEYDSIIDLKGRVGYPSGPALFYAALGYSSSRFAEDGRPNETLGGLGFGIGVDYKIGSRYFIGAEYYWRDQSGSLDYAPGWSIRDTSLDTFTIRGGIQF